MMQRPEHVVQTFVGPETIVPLEIYGSEVRHQLILIRDAVHALRTSDAKEIEVAVQRKEWSLTLKVRK